jgi:hypothetical protein
MEIAFQYIDTILVFAVFALSLNLLQGYAGQVSVAQAAFGAIGGYALALLFLDAGVGPAWGLAIGTIAAGFAGFLVGLPALRLTTEWLILLTLAVQTIVVTLVQTDHALGGSFGLQNVAGLRIFGLPLDEPSQMFPLFLVLAAIVYLTCYRLGDSPYGRVLRAIRDDATACRSLGKRVGGIGRRHASHRDVNRLANAFFIRPIRRHRRNGRHRRRRKSKWLARGRSRIDAPRAALRPPASLQRTGCVRVAARRLRRSSRCRTLGSSAGSLSGRNHEAT